MSFYQPYTEEIKRVKEILAEHGIEMEIHTTYDRYYAPHVKFTHKGEIILDGQCDFDDEESI